MDEDAVGVNDSVRAGGVHGLLARVVNVRPHEVATLMWAWGYIFTLLSSYYVMRPIRDQVGAAGGVKNLPWLFLGTLICMIVLNLPYGALVKALPRSRFIALTYRFFAVSILLFAVAFHGAGKEAMVWYGRAYFIWLSVFNLFVVSVFWGLIVDTFGPEDGKRLFGFIAAGATIGAITGSSVTATLAKNVPAAALLVIAALLLEVAVFCVRHLSRHSAQLDARADVTDPDAPVGGTVFAGFTHAFSSRYLVNIVFFMLLFSVSSTFVYFQQADIVARSFSGRGAQTAFFAQIDLAVNVLTLVVQLGFTARIVRALGVPCALALLPFITIAGFGALALVPSALALMAVQVVRRSSDYAIARPLREVLYTVVAREDRYKTKSFIDTVVYRTGDQLGAWVYVLLMAAGMSMPQVALVGVALGMVWLFNGLWLGRRQDVLARASAAVPRRPRALRAGDTAVGG